MAGRPTKEPGQRMNVPLKIMLTPEQDEAIRRAAANVGMDVSAWARPALLDAAYKVMTQRMPNQGILEAIAKIEQIQKGMNPKQGKDTLEYLREAREGGMYGYGPDK
jgi:uncharacterized protein (DUF1778 family)